MAHRRSIGWAVGDRATEDDPTSGMSWWGGGGGGGRSTEPWVPLLSADASGRLSLGEEALAKLEAIEVRRAAARHDARNRPSPRARGSFRAANGSVLSERSSCDDGVGGVEFRRVDDSASVARRARVRGASSPAGGRAVSR